MNTFYDERRSMKGIIWALETYEDGEWQPRAINKNWDSPVLQHLWNWFSVSSATTYEGYQQNMPGLPRRIKAYVRYSDVLDQQRAEEYERLWRTDGNRL